MCVSFLPTAAVDSKQSRNIISLFGCLNLLVTEKRTLFYAKFKLQTVFLERHSCRLVTYSPEKRTGQKQ